jgi:hypothetical protein
MGATCLLAFLKCITTSAPAPQSSASMPDASSTYFSPGVQLMPISSMDPSIAMGFYCQHTGNDFLSARTLNTKHIRGRLVLTRVQTHLVLPLVV